MTVKEMGPVNRSRSPAFFLSHSCLRRGARAEKSGPFEPPLSGLFGLRLAGVARPIEDKSLAFALFATSVQLSGWVSDGSSSLTER